jgi:DM4/DM12 family
LFHCLPRSLKCLEWKFNLSAGKSDPSSGEKSFLSGKAARDNHKSSLQFIAGIGVPVDLEPESMTIGYVFKAQYFLPYNESQLYPSRLTRDAADDDEVRWAIYRTLELALNSKNIDGRQCVLRAICEASRLPFDHESGLLGEIFHILFV